MLNDPISALVYWCHWLVILMPAYTLSQDYYLLLSDLLGLHFVLNFEFVDACQYIN